MKKIEAIVPPERVNGMRQLLLNLGIANMTLLEAKEMGTQKGLAQVYRGIRFRLDYLLQVKVEVFVADHLAQAAVGVMIAAARMGEVGGGSIFVSNVEIAAGVQGLNVEALAQSHG